MSCTEHTETSELCQIETAQAGGRLRRPGILYVPMRIVQHLRQAGVRASAARAFELLDRITRRRPGRKLPAARVASLSSDILDLQPGELVEVKSLAEIEATLDSRGRYCGLVFTPEMKKHCGKQYRVFKRLSLMFDEYHKSQRRVKHTVLLRDVVCEGAGLGCDRACFLYWREVWLRRVDSNGSLTEQSESLKSSYD